MTKIYSSTAHVSDHTYLRAGFKNNIISCFRLYWWTDKSFAALKTANIFLESYCLMVCVCIWLTAIDKLVELPLCLEAKRIYLQYCQATTLTTCSENYICLKLSSEWQTFWGDIWENCPFFCYKISLTGEIKVNFPSATKETVEESLLQDLFLKLCRKLLESTVSAKCFTYHMLLRKKTIIGCKSYI